ncbi:MAG: hypothetical protein U1A27_08515 [Phycisphaerae bacterium]
MDECAANSLDPRIFEANLRALRAHLPEIADRLTAAAAPAGLALCRAEDDTPTLTWPDGRGATRWLGDTRLPTARAAGLLRAFDAGSGNVLLVGAGGGHEFAPLLGRLDRTRALFVVEPDAAALALALRLHDCAAAIAAGRLLPFAGEPAWDALRDYLLAHAGCLPPQRILAWPWFSANDTHAVSARAGEIAAAVGRARDARLRAVAVDAGPPLDPGQVDFVCPGADPAALDLAQRLAESAAERRLVARHHLADSPQQMHPLALAEHLARSPAQTIILIDRVRADMAARLRRDARVITWLSPGAALTVESAQRLEPADGLVVMNGEQADLARRGGHERTRLCRPAARRTQPARRRPLLLLADWADLAAGAAGLRLASHVALWETAQKLFASRAEGYADADFDALFARVERDSGVRIGDAAVRDAVAARVRHLLAPALVGRVYIDALLAAGIDFDLAGRGWDSDTRAAPRWCGREPPADAVYDFVTAVRPGATHEWQLLDAVAAGAVPLVRAPRGVPDLCADELWPADAAVRYASAAELIAAAQRPAPRTARESAAERVRARHTWAHRLVEALALVGSRTGDASVAAVERYARA